MKRYSVKILISLIFLAHTGIAFAGGNLKGEVKIQSKGVFGKKGFKDDASNVVVFIENINEPMASTKKISQKNKKFLPRVLPIVQGGIVEFPNEDPFNHNVFSPTPEFKFDLDYYGFGKSKKVKFAKTGSVRIYCNIHSSMVSDILVLPSKYFAKAKKNGNFIIKDIPAGKYTIVAWQPTGASERRGVTIKDGKDTTLDFTVVETVFNIQHKNKFGKTYEKDY